MKKRLLALLLAGVLGVASLTGCAGGISDSDVVATMGDIQVNAKLYNFFARYMQAQYETYYKGYIGEDMWTTEAEEGKTYEEAVKQSTLETVETMLVLEQHMGDYDISLSEDDLQTISDLADKFISSNDADALKTIGADKTVAERALTLVAIQNKMVDAITANADTNVSDEEAAQKKMQYVIFSTKTTDEEGNTTDMSDEEKAAVKKEAEAFAEEIKDVDDIEALAKEKEYNPVTKTFDAEATAPAAEVIAKADTMEAGEVAVVEGERAFYAVKLINTFDREATDEKKESIISNRKSELYTEIVNSWLGLNEIVTNEEVLAKISYLDPIVSIKMDEEEAATDAE